jgi:hypothetical protein
MGVILMNTTLNFQSDKLIIVYFPSFARGKFIMNCLSMSRHAVPLNRKVAKHLVDFPDDYDYRLQSILSSLPPKDKMKNWRTEWEFGDIDFYQGNPHKLLSEWKQIKTTAADQLLSNLISTNMHFFITAHGGGAERVKLITEVWTNAKIIGLINYSKFWNIAVNLKSDLANKPTLLECAGNDCNDKYQILKGDDWPDWKTFEKYHYDIAKLSNNFVVDDSIKQEIEQFYQWHEINNPLFCFDVDNTYFNKQNFLKKIMELYSWLGFDDFNPVLIGNYYDRYIELHS